MNTKTTLASTILLTSLGLGLGACAEDAQPLLEDQDITSPDEIEEALETIDEIEANEAEQSVSGTAQQPCAAGSGIDTGVIVALHDDTLSIDCDLGATPVPAGWVASSTFSPYMGEVVPGKLQRYCSYTFLGGNPTQSNYSRMFKAIDTYPQSPLANAAVDCVAMEPSSGLNGDPDLDDGLYQAFRANSGAVDSLGNFSLAPVGIYVLDTVDWAWWELMEWERNTHGARVGHIIDELLCPDNLAYCDSHKHHIVALPRESGDTQPHTEAPNNVGSFQDAADAAYEGLMDWRVQRQGPNPELRAVFVMAFAAKAQLDPDFAAGPYAALRDVIDVITCNGGLIVAAAGNNDDPECPANAEYALAPAKFEESIALDADACADLGVIPLDAVSYPVFGADRPPVHAIGLLDAHDQAGTLSRPEGEPQLSAYGRAWVPNTTAGTPLPSMYGTSVSTATAGAIMALIWALKPDLKPHEVFELARDGAYDTGRVADFDMSGMAPYPNVRRLSVCGGLEEVCSLPGVNCPSSDCKLPAAAPADGNLTDYWTAVDDAIASTIPSELFAGGPALVGAPSCEDPQAEDLILPMPENPACPQCNVDTGDPDPAPNLLHVDILAAYKGDISGGRLTTYDNAGGILDTFVFTGPQVAAMNDVALTIVDVEVDADDAELATVIFDLYSGRPTIGDVPIH